MGVFLGFNKNDLLVEIVECASGPYASQQPEKMIPNCPRVIELHPEILMETRPEVFHQLVDYAGYTKNGLQVANFDEMSDRIRDKAIAQVEESLVQAATAAAQLDLASTLVDLPPRYQMRREALTDDLEQLRIELELLVSGATPVHVPERLGKLAGTRVKI